MKKSHLRQFLAEIGGRDILNDLSDEQCRQVISELQAMIPDMSPGDFVFFLTPEHSARRRRGLQTAGVVAALDESGFLVALADQSRVLQVGLDGSVLDADPEDEHFGVIALPFSGAARRTAHRLLGTLGVQPGGPYRVDASRPGASSYVISEMELAAGRVCADLLLPYPGALPPAETKDETLRDAAAMLPGRDDEVFDGARGYVGWGPYEDYARTMVLDRHTSLPLFLSEHRLNVFDFYFSLPQESVACPHCDRTGLNRDYAELADGFYPSGGGRWSGWGSRLTQEEVDALAARMRFTTLTHVFHTEESPSDPLTRQAIQQRAEWSDADWEEKLTAGLVVEAGETGLYRVVRGMLRHADGRTPSADEINTSYNARGVMGHDSINRWIVTPIRAAALGISTAPCQGCEGHGSLALSREKLSLSLWAGCLDDEIDIVIRVEEVPLESIPGLRTLLAEHYRVLDGLLGALAERSALPILPMAARPVRDGSGWRSDMDYASWADWLEHMQDADDDYNLVVGYAFSPHRGPAPGTPRDALIDTGFAIMGENLIPDGRMAIWLAHPRKGAVRTAFVQRVEEADRDEMVAFFERSRLTHRRHFAWVTGANDVQDEGSGDAGDAGTG